MPTANIIISPKPTDAMKKTLKIAGITLASLFGLVILVAIVALSVVTSSGKLTAMVKKYAPEFVSCEIKLGKADLSLVRTFPNIGLEIDHVALINPMAGTSDTLAYIDRLIVSADAKEFMKNKKIVVRQCILDNALVNVHFDAEGNSNLNVFKTTQSDDTTSTAFGYLVDLEEVKLNNTRLVYTDLRSDMHASTSGLDLCVKGSMDDTDIDAKLNLAVTTLSLDMPTLTTSANGLTISFDGKMKDFDLLEGTLELTSPNISLALSEAYLENDALSLHIPMEVSMATLSGRLNDAVVGLNDYLVHLAGDAAMAGNGDINLDLELSTNTLIIDDIMTYLPEKVQQSISGISYSGNFSITEAQVVGTFNDSLMPLITAKIVTDKATFDIPSLPYPFTDVDLEALIDLNLNEQSDVTINQLNARFNQTCLKINGLISDVTANLAMNLDVKADMPMNDIQGFLPGNIRLNGRTDLDLKAKFTLDQLMTSLDDYNLNRLFADATLNIKDFDLNMDTIHAHAPMLNVRLTLPASRKGKDRAGAYIDLTSSNLQAQAGNNINAIMNGFHIAANADRFKGQLEQMILNAALDMASLDLTYDTIKVNTTAPAITMATLPSKQDSGLNASVTFRSNELAANMGQAYSLNTNKLSVEATANQDKTKTDLLNQWSPTADFSLTNATVNISGLSEPVFISNIDFLFNSHELGFRKSTLRIGGSDISLEGNVVGIKEWIEDHKNLMKGELQLTSNMLDINEIMALTSGLGRTDDGQEPEPDNNSESNPFMVPEGIDFNFGITTKKSLYDNFDLNNLSGTMTIKDGTLILQEIGFTNKAAEMQLTAMYQSPRENNLFLAMDFHLLNVQISDLLHMVPYIDTLVPMLKTFDGQAEFHIDAQTNLNSNYQPKISTLRAAADIEGRNLSVNDKFTFTKITDMLKVSTDGAYRIDSLDVQLTAFKDEIDLWPSQIAIGKYKVTVDGRMNLDQTGEYHLSVTQTPLPMRMGLKISGPFNDLKFDVESCKYPNLYKPGKRNDTEQMYFDLKKRIADALKANVR